MDLGSDGWGSTRAGKRRRLPAGDQFRGGARPEKVRRGLPDSFWAGVWPGRISVERVIHPRGCWGSERSGAGRARAVAGLLDGARRRGEFGRFWGGILGAKDSWSACGAKASQCGPCAGLRSAAASPPRRTAAPAAAERRRSLFQPPRWSTSPRT